MRAEDRERLYARITELMSTGQPVLIGIDGRCGSGKTSLASLLTETYSGRVFHMDDFYLRREQRSEERLNRPGENVDHERFLEEVLLPARRGEAVFLRPIIHGLFEPGKGEWIPYAPLTVVEGSYSCHYALKDFYDLSVFLTTPPETQRSRLLRREGETRLREFEARWIPLEEAYFQAFHTAERCDMIIET